MTIRFNRLKEITLKDLQKVDIRIGTVIEAEVPYWSHWVMKLTVDLGEEVGTRTIFAGIMHFYKPDDLIGKQFPFVVNMKPKRIGPEGDFSSGMMIAADGKLEKPIVVEGEEIQNKPVLLQPVSFVTPGTKLC